MTRILAAVVAILVLATGFIPGAHAQSTPPARAPADTRPSEAVAHARRVERRALRTSFAELDAFGRAASRRMDAEGLGQLQHVIRITLNQGEFAAAQRWNRLLEASARRQDDRRYIAVAQVNALQIRHLRDHDVSVAEFESLARKQTDWLPEVFAQTALARRLLDDGRIGDALRLSLDTIPRIPDDRANEASVAAAAWDMVAIAHVMIDDVSGYLKAIDKAEAHIAASDYPRPDYESVYNLTQSLSYLGRHDEALALVDVYARLAARSGTSTSRGYAGNICAFAASSRDDWAGVLDCLAPHGAELAVPDVVKNSMLPFRATAYARTGQVALAQRDLDEIQARIAKGDMSSGGGVRRAEAELLIAKGDHARGVPALRSFHLARTQRISIAAAAAMEQVVGNMEDQLQAAKEQNRLKNEVITSHRLLVALLAVMGAVLGWMVLLLSKQRKRYLHLSIADPLTGLPNRRHTERHLGRMVDHAVSRGGRAVIVVIDLDDFKSCNDTFGHEGGDDALRTFANLVNETIRPGDFFGRWGGEEFLLAIPDAGLDEARAVLERIVDRAGNTRAPLAPGYPLHFSAGAVDVPRSATTLGETLQIADQLLYAAKDAGKNRIRYVGDDA